jgi:hypothetical protein
MMLCKRSFSSTQITHKNSAEDNEIERTPQYQKRNSHPKYEDKQIQLSMKASLSVKPLGTTPLESSYTTLTTRFSELLCLQ